MESNQVEKNEQLKSQTGGKATDAAGDSDLVVREATESASQQPLTATETSPLLAENESSITTASYYEKQETWLSILLQVTLPFLISGMGSVGAGILLSLVEVRRFMHSHHHTYFTQHWPVFEKIPELMALVTPLLGLKGNLMMASASRLSTLTNLNKLHTCKQKLHAFLADLFATQVLSIVAGFMASVVAIVLGLASKRKDFHYHQMFLICSSSILTSSISASVLGMLIFGIIVLTKKVNINPDNVATPLAASIGDITSLGILASLANVLYLNLDTYPWISFIFIGCFVVALPILLWLTYRDPENKKVLNASWPRICVSMMILSGGGALLEITSPKHIEMTLYQPIINGVGGSLVSVQASRVSTYFHRHYKPGELPHDKNRCCSNVCESPVQTFFRNGINSTAARVFLCLLIPGQCIFVTATHYISKTRHSQYSFSFLGLYLGAAFTQVTTLLCFCQIIINVVWSKNGDPDLFAIPFLTALGDLFGTVFLFTGLEIRGLFVRSSE